MSVITDNKQCKQCKKWFHALELFLYYCRECWTKRPMEMQRFVQRQQFKRCDDCGKWVIAGQIAWDCQATAFSFLCINCFNGKVFKDDLYRGTPFAHEWRVS